MQFQFRRVKVVTVALLLGLGATERMSAAAPEPVIKVTAQRFFYTPGDIRLKKGVPVVLEFTSKDVLMGFNVPDLGVRADIVPGQVARVRIVPDKTGTFVFLCDIFCGAGHENMSGTITVVD